MFDICVNGKSIYQPTDETLTLLSPRLTLEMGKAGSLSFQIPSTHSYYNMLDRLTTTITVDIDGVEIFRGRVLSNDRSFNKIRTIYCEGNLAYLVDTVQKGTKYEGEAHALFRKIIEAHNARAEAEKQFTVGEITVENRAVLIAGKSDDIQDAETGSFDYKQIALNSIADEWMTSFDYIESTLIDYVGGYLRTRHQNGVTYIDLLKDYGSSTTQEIEFGINLLDLTEETPSEDIFTILIPLGDENLTIESVNNGSDELADANAVKQYGRIIKTHVFSGVTEAATLLENGKRYLENHVGMQTTITAKAVDIHLIDSDTAPIYIGSQVRVTSASHGLIGETLTCTKIEYDFENPANNTYTFGIPKQSLTERYRKDKRLDNNGSAAGSAAKAVAEEAETQLNEFFDAWINVDSETAHIDLGTLYKKYENTVTVLESSCGISMDAPSGNINIKTLRNEVDNLGNTLAEQSAYIDLLNNELGARIELVASRHSKLEAEESSHYAELILLADDQESKIASMTEHITKLDGQMIESDTSITQLTNDLQAQITLEAAHKKELDGKITSSNASITQLANDLQAQITLEAAHKKELDGKITSSNASITQLANDLQAQITLEASHHDAQSSTIASISAKADKNESSIKLKANKTYVDSEILSVTGKIEAAEAKIISMEAVKAEIKSIVADNINSMQADISWLKATSISSDVGVYAPYIRATKGMTLDGKTVATQEWTTTKLDDYATQSWVTAKGYLTEIPNTCSAKTGFYAPYIRATKDMSLGGYTVATQAWVKEQLANYSKSDHSHAWSAITEKPSTFTPKSHTHSFSGSYALSWGHTHTTSSSFTAGSRTGGVYNYAQKSITISGTTKSN